MLSVNTSANAMTIPSRPAPPPPKPNNMRQQNYGSVNNPGAKPISRYAPTTNWDDKPFDNNAIDSAFMLNSKKIAPPRPPPPKTNHQPVLKKSATPNSVNILSHLFGAKRSKTPPNRIGLINPGNKIPPKVPPPPSYSLSNPKSNSNSTSTNVQLIDFNSPPSSPTLTQKSNSDCVSVDSFSSDSIYSPNNGNISQTESGFEDDFNLDSLHIKNKDPWEPIDPFEMSGESKKTPILPPPPSNLLLKSTGPKPYDFVDPLCNGKSLIAPMPPVAAPTIIRPIGKKRDNYAALSQVTESQIKEDNFGDTTPPSPPMPSMPPPPPPPEFFVENCAPSVTYDDNNYTDSAPGDSYGISLFDFGGIQEDDLDFRANEKIYLLRKINEEWYYGRNKRGCEGMFPINYLDVKIALPTETNPEHILSSMAAVRQNQTQIKVKALYTFNGEVADDLKLIENDMVEILYEINDEWLYGRIGSRVGQFPANFVEYVPKNLPKMP